MIDRRSSEQVSDDLALTEYYLCEGEDDSSDMLLKYSEFRYYKGQLLDVVKDVLEGKGESADTNSDYIVELLEECSVLYADIVMSADMDEWSMLAAAAMDESLDGLGGVCLAVNPDHARIRYNVNDSKISFDEILDASDESDEFYDYLKNVYNGTYGELIDWAVSDAPENLNDLRKVRNAERLAKVKSVALGIGTAALGAGLAVATTHLISSRRK